MKRKILLSALMFLTFAVTLAFAQTDCFYSGKDTVCFKLHGDLLYIKWNDNSNVEDKENILKDNAISITVQTDSFAIIKINALKTSIENIKIYPEVANFANVLEYKDGTLQIPQGILVCPKSDTDIGIILSTLENANARVVSSDPLYEGSDVFKIKLDTELNNILGLVNMLAATNYINFVEPNFLRVIGGEIASVTIPNQVVSSTADISIRQTGQMLQIISSTPLAYVSLYNLAGRRQNVWAVPSVNGVISLSNIAAGTYIVRGSNGKKTISKRILVR